MLVLTRKVDQKIHVGNDVVITIVHIKGQSVRVGIDAPRQVRIMRGELQSNVESSSSVETSHNTASAGPNATVEASTQTATVSSSVASHGAPSVLKSTLSSRGERDWSERLESRSFSRPDRLLSGGAGLTKLVAAHRAR